MPVSGNDFAVFYYSALAPKIWSFTLVIKRLEVLDIIMVTDDTFAGFYLFRVT